MKEFTYAEYVKRRACEKRREKYAEMLSRARDDWKRETALIVPRWLQIVSLYIPPDRFVRATKWLVAHMPPERWVKWVVFRSGWPRLVVWPTIYVCATPATLINWLVMRPLMFVRRTVRTFGTFTSIKPLTKEKIRMRIFYWGREIYSGEYSCSQ